jgi:hypothetical protein
MAEPSDLREMTRLEKRMSVGSIAPQRSSPTQAPAAVGAAELSAEEKEAQRLERRLSRGGSDIAGRGGGSGLSRQSGSTSPALTKVAELKEGTLLEKEESRLMRRLR